MNLYSKYGIINSKDKTVVSAKFDNIEYVTDKYPIIKVRYNGSDLLYNLANNKELQIDTNKENITIKDNYIVVGSSYYNYSGKLIYTVK